MGFSSLPSEIQLQVFSYADIPTLKAARRVSRQSRDNASQYLFKQALICPRKIVLRARRNISQHPVYSTYVGELVFDASIADPYLVENPRIYDRRVEVELGPHGESTRDSQRYWSYRAYVKLFNDQKELYENGIFTRELETALKRMPNVSSIRYTPGPRQLPLEARFMQYIPWCRLWLFPPQPMAPTDLPAFPLWLESVGRYLMAAGPDPTEWIQSVHALVRSYDFGIHHVIRAIHKTSYSGVREFHVLADDGLDGEPGVSFTMTAFNSLSVQQHRAAAYLFRGLSKLELNFSSCLIAHDETVFSLHHHSGERRQQLAQLAALLKGAKSLTELGLHFSDRPGLLDDIAVFTMFMYQHELEDDPPRCLLTWIGFDTTWPKLRSLTLTGAFTVEDTLVAFIKRHAATLHQVKFNYCCLMVGTWANFVDEAVSRPSIHAFTLNGVHEYATPGEEENITRMEKSTRAELLYRGAIEIDAEGHRYFKSTSTRSVYVTRNDSGSL